MIMKHYCWKGGGSDSKHITHLYFFAKGKMKYAAMLAYIKQYSPKKAIIFSRTKHEANVIHMVLVKQGHDAILLHGGLTQARREKSLNHFRTGSTFLIATNVAARGLDIDNVTDVINFDAPDSPTDYVHRVGRSARMGKEGRASEVAGALTPVPGGVGPLTIAMLMYNTVKAAKMRRGSRTPELTSK